MRISFLLILLTLYISHACFAQDIVTTAGGEKIRAKVLKVTPDDIQYKLFDNQGGPLHTMAKADITEITYENGSKDIFNDAKTSPYDGGLTLAERGFRDAQIYYRPPMTGPIFAGVFFGYGFIPAIISYSTPPRYENLNFPDDRLMDKYEYREAYTSTAGQIKRKRTAEGFGIGTAIILSVIIGGTIASMSH